MRSLNPRVYVACLSCYNSGRLAGEWFDADDGLPDVHAEWAERHEAGLPQPGETVPDPPCDGEEFLVHDHEDFGAYDPGECSPSEAAEIGQALRDADRNGAMLAALADHLGQPPQDIRNPEDYYAGDARSIEDWAEDWARDCGNVPEEPLASYIDWERYARDLKLGGDVFTVDNPDGGVWVFWNR